MPVRLIVTRPQPESGRWAQLLRERGFQVLELPLIVITPAPDARALQRAWGELPGLRAAMFVSRNAVDGFFAGHPRPAWPGNVRAWATGPGTRDALLAHGVPPAQVDAPGADAPQFDSESLWEQVAAQVRPGDRVLLVRGTGESGEGRPWLAGRLVQAGAQVDTAVAYRRELPDWSASEIAQARRACEDGSLWLFSSSQALDHLCRLLGDRPFGRAHALATHPRIAQAVRDCGFGDVREAPPGLDAVAAVVASIESAG